MNEAAYHGFIDELNDLCNESRIQLSIEDDTGLFFLRPLDRMESASVENMIADWELHGYMAYEPAA